MQACPLFLGRHIRGVRNGPSPDWLRRRLEAIGLRPISALVDITNFLTFDLNRPLHVFDAGRLDGDLVVRLARAGETLLALNGQEYALDPEMTVIADRNGVQSLGGVIGGEATGCTEATTEVFIEAALFDPVRTAATGRRLEHRQRRALSLRARARPGLCRGRARNRDAADARTVRRRGVRGRRRRRRAGLAAPLRAARRAPGEPRRARMSRPRKVPRSSKPSAARSRRWPAAISSVEPPSWRGDIEGEADLVEEVLRVKGYDHIPAVPLPREAAVAAPGARSPARRRSELVRRALAGARPDRGGSVFIHLGARGRAVRRRQARIAGRQPDQRRSRCDAAVLAAGTHRRGAPQRRSRLSRRGVVRIGAALSRRHPRGPGARRRRAARRAAPVPSTGASQRARDRSLSGQGRCARGTRRDGRPGRERPDQRRPAGLVSTPAGPAPCGSGPTLLGAFRRTASGGDRSVRSARARSPAFEVFLDAVPEPRAGRAKPPLQLSVFQPIERDFAFVVDRDAAGRGSAARRPRGRPQARRRDPPVRRLRGHRSAAGQEVARHHHRAAAAGTHPDRCRDRGVFAAASSPRSKKPPAARCGADDAAGLDAGPGLRYPAPDCGRFVRSGRADRPAALLGLRRDHRGALRRRTFRDRRGFDARAHAARRQAAAMEPPPRLPAVPVALGDRRSRSRPFPLVGHGAAGAAPRGARGLCRRVGSRSLGDACQSFLFFRGSPADGARAACDLGRSLSLGASSRLCQRDPDHGGERAGAVLVARSRSRRRRRPLARAADSRRGSDAANGLAGLPGLRPAGPLAIAAGRCW